jgi:hypothetical protein
MGLGASITGSFDFVMFQRPMESFQAGASALLLSLPHLFLTCLFCCVVGSAVAFNAVLLLEICPLDTAK